MIFNDHGRIVYFAQCEGFVKIGRSSAPARRIQDIDKCPFPVTLFCELFTNDSVWLERVLQDTFAEYHHYREWFKMDIELLRPFVGVKRIDNHGQLKRLLRSSGITPARYVPPQMCGQHRSLRIAALATGKTYW